MAKLHIETEINDEPTEFLCEGQQSLLEALRDIIGLTGTKEGCTTGDCGACSVMLDGQLVPSCLVLAAEAQGLTAVLRAEFEHSQGQALAQMEARVPRLPADSRRWIGEMEEIAKTFADAGVTPGFHEGAAAVFRLLAQTPFAAETPETMDKSRTMKETVREAAKHLPGAEPKSDG